MDYKYYLRNGFAELRDAADRVVDRLDRGKLDYMIVRGFMGHAKDCRGLWNYKYDKGEMTEADRIILTR